MRYCSKCGRKLEDNDLFCAGCGNRVNKKNNMSNNSNTSVKDEKVKNTQQPEIKHPDPNSVQYVYVNKKTGKIANNPHVKTKSEGCLQYAGIAFAAVALVILMVCGTVLLTNYLSDDYTIIDQEDEWNTSSSAQVSSTEDESEVSSGTVSSQTVSSETVSSEYSLPVELTAKYMNKKIKGKWKTDIPYKNMNLPGTFEFDGKGKVKCTIKAFLFSKKFEGTYTIKDGGKCTLTLEGLEEYFEDDTLNGDLRFVTDDKMEFTVEDTVWKLNRTE